MLELDTPVASALGYLTELAYNLHWTWTPESQQLFERLAPGTWRQFHHNPLAMLGGAELERIGRLLRTDPSLGKAIARRYDELKAYLGGAAWRDPEVAYFSAEFGLSECLPIYAGGLGVLAGDHLKAASDLGLPLVGVGLFYHRGYFRQRIDPDGRQREEYPVLDPERLPLWPVGPPDQPVRVVVELPGRAVRLGVWRADVGRVPLYLLDANLPENRPEDREITARLYGGDAETRLCQELVLGIGGVRALAALGLNPRVDHMNEGHAAFLAIERIRVYAQETGCGFAEARTRVRPRLAFTTHTAVPAGIDYFDPALLTTYLAPYCCDLGVDPAEILALGREDPTDPGSWFSMAVLALNTTSRQNAVSTLHRRVATTRWPGLTTRDGTRGTIQAITNGVHNATWVAGEMASLLSRHVSPTWEVCPERADVWMGIRTIPDADLWKVRNALRRRLVDEVNERRGAGNTLRPDVLTIGFARRFATYKRASLLLRDWSRFRAILTNSERPVQIIFAGKAHPRDESSKDVLQELYRAASADGRGSIAVLDDYDLGLGRCLVQGCDVWLNTPRRPHEASGTSGMKAALNGALNVSVLDGWWDEAYRPEIGWAIGDRAASWEDGETDARDDADARAAYDTLEQQVAPLFYDRDFAGHPRAWLAMVRASLEEISPRFSAARMIVEYFRDLYGFTDLTRINHDQVGTFRSSPITVATHE